MGFAESIKRGMSTRQHSSRSRRWHQISFLGHFGPPIVLRGASRLEQAVHVAAEDSAKVTPSDTSALTLLFYECSFRCCIIFLSHDDVTSLVNPPCVEQFVAGKGRTLPNMP